jgi:hypothetical protein
MIQQRVLVAAHSTSRKIARPHCHRCVQVRVIMLSAQFYELQRDVPVFNVFLNPACSTTACQLSNSFTAANCTLYADRRCKPCGVCSASSNQYLVLPCSEYWDTTCGDCGPPCGQGTFEAIPCGGTNARACKPCDVSCAACTGNSSFHCTACSPGYVSVDMGKYGGVPGKRQCVLVEECKYSNWSSWSNCSLDCGGGVSMRTRNITNLFPCAITEITEDLVACNTAVCSEIVGVIFVRCFLLLCHRHRFLWTFPQQYRLCG